MSGPTSPAPDHPRLRPAHSLSPLPAFSHHSRPPPALTFAYGPYIRYKWVFCAHGSCYGARLWTGTDMANPNEIVGPVRSTDCLAPSNSLVGFGYTHNDQTVQFDRHQRFPRNSNFSDRFWVISGDPLRYYPSPSADHIAGVTTIELIFSLISR